MLENLRRVRNKAVDSVDAHLRSDVTGPKVGHPNFSGLVFGVVDGGGEVAFASHAEEASDEGF